MRLLRSLCSLGLLSAWAVADVLGQENVGASHTAAPLTSPYAPRDGLGQAGIFPTTAGRPGDFAAATPGTTNPSANLLSTQPQGQEGSYTLVSLGSGGGAMPAMIGDFLGPYHLRALPVVIFNTATGDRDPAAPLGGLPILSRGPFKVSENESPEPQSRAYVTYNFFKLRGNYPDINPFIREIDLHRITVGLEQAFWNGHGSVGVRLPWFKSHFAGRTRIVPNADDGFDIAFPLVDELEDSELGDVTLVFKGAFGCCAEHKLCSFGLAVTLPTGPSIEAFDPGTGAFQNKHSGILQPFVGYLWTASNWYVHGFFSVAFPAHTGDDVIILFSDIGFGYYLYGAPPGLNVCGGSGGMACAGACPPSGLLGCCGLMGALGQIVPMWVTSIVPTLELHLNTPLTNGGKYDYFQTGTGVLDYVVSSGDNVLMSQSLIVTGGVHFGLMGASTLTIGAAVPLNVQPYDIMGVVQLNWRF